MRAVEQLPCQPNRVHWVRSRATHARETGRGSRANVASFFVEPTTARVLHSADWKRHSMRVLVVYFSRTGTTKAVAQELARELGADIEMITERSSRAGWLGWLKSGYEATFGKTGAIHAPLRDPSTYDLVILGTPTWNAAPCTPLLSYVRMLRKTLPKVALFCTFDGRGEDSVFAKLRDEIGQEPVAVLGLPRAQVETGLAHAKIVSFAGLLERDDHGQRTDFTRARSTLRPRAKAAEPTTPFAAKS